MIKQAHMIIFVFYTLHQRCFKVIIQDISIIKHIFVTNRYNSTKLQEASFLEKQSASLNHVLTTCIDGAVLIV